MSEWDLFNAWITKGIEKGWCSEVVCDTHDGVPMSVEETEEWQDGNDFCVPIVRLWGMERVL